MITKFWESGLGQLIIDWALAVVAFFVLWAVLTKVIKRISEKKEQSKADLEENEKATNLES